MAIHTYDIGDVVKIFSNFKQNGLDMDPSTITLKVVRPDATSQSYTYAGGTVVKDSTGNYHVDVAPAISGTYKYRWSSSGTGAAAEEGTFQVRTQKVP